MGRPLILIIMDGFGVAIDESKSAITADTTPFLTEIFHKYPTVQIGASGVDVGLPAGQMGNSEVGHTNIGAGRVVHQELTRISSSIADGSFWDNAALAETMDRARSGGKSLHLMGLLSDGGVHSHIDHLYALVKMAKQRGLTRVYVHAFLDGRDVSPTSGADFVKQCDNKLRKIGVGKVATVMGRYYAMDRDKRWNRVKMAYDAVVCGEGRFENDPVAAVHQSYESGKTDEFVLPVVCNPAGTINSGDSVVFFNFRPDRARQLTRALVCPDFAEFNRQKVPKNLNFVCMTQYDKLIPNVSVAFGPQEIHNAFGEYISKHGFSQLRIAETEKYAHVTFFFNGGVENPSNNEDRILIPSPKVATYDLKPEMSARKIKDTVIEKINTHKYDVIILNFANCDMVGHSGVFGAAKQAVRTVDSCVHEVVQAILNTGGCAIITADHGNADKMLNDDGSPFTAHTTNPVPFCVVGHQCKPRDGGRLADVAPTMLKILDLPIPPEMTGKSLIIDENV